MSLKSLFLITSLLAGLTSIRIVQAEPIFVAQNSNESVTLDLQNMACAMCKFTIKKALQNIDGVQKISVDYDTKTASVTFDAQKTNAEALIKATTDAGYPATVRQTD